MLTKEEMYKLAEEHFHSNGFLINQYDDNLIVEKEDVNYDVIAMGTVSDLSSGSKKGKTFNKNQIKNILGLALFEASKKLTANNKNRIIFVVPDNKIYIKQLKEILGGIKQLNILVYLSSEVGQLSLF